MRSDAIMALPPGSSLGAYEILSPLGAGGMGEVYRARDTRLGREVAVKILPDAFANDPERLARFQREAQMLAALNHPHIAAIYGLEDAPSTSSGQAGATKFLVLELVDGESLAERLARRDGSALDFSVAESLRIARQIVDALEAAHDKGIVHRDLKPANIMLTADGQVKVLDFGLAKIDAASASVTGASEGMTHSPTLTFAATQAGVILGTAAYMSPEQAKGRAADKRSDVWAFGCVLFEMLTSKRAFEGEDVSDTLAAILRAEPDWKALPPDLPPYIGTIVSRCLTKDRKTRIPDMSVVRFMLDENALASDVNRAASAIGPVEGLHEHGRLPLLWKAAAALLLVTTLAAVAGWWRASRAIAPAVTRFFVYAPEKQVFAASNGLFTGGVISPDGRKLVFPARDATGKTMLWVRPLDALAAHPLAGTENAANPFWSPDSRSIGFFAPGKVMKVASTGGPPQTLCSSGGNRGGTWNRDGVIVVNGGPGISLRRVSAGGGELTQALRLLPGHTAQVFPTFLPDGHHVLFYVYGATEDTTGIYVGSLDTGESTRLTGADSGAVFAPSGRLLFVRDGTLLAQPFSLTNRTLADEPIPIAERVESTGVPGFVSFSVSDTGVLAYGIGSGRVGGLQIVWVDRDGKAMAPVGPLANYRGIELSPDARLLAVHRHEAIGGDVWVTDLSRGTTSRLTFDASQENAAPIWSPDGSRIVFSSHRNGKWGLYLRAANGVGDEERLLESITPVIPYSWSPDGRAIAYGELDPNMGSDLWVLPVTSASSSAPAKPAPLVRTPFSEAFAQISPDGKWLAYASNETGRNEVYVRPFPAGAGKSQVSTNGGTFPRWRRDGRELFYLDVISNGKMVAVDVNGAGATFAVGSPQELFDSGYVNFGHLAPYLPFAVSPDGRRFLIPRVPTPMTLDAQSAPIAVVLNWDVGLKK